MTYKMCTQTSIYLKGLKLNNKNLFSSIPGTVKAVPDSFIGNTQKSTIRVLGIDPGLANTGWGIVDFSQNRYRLVEYGVIETKKEAIHGERLLEIYNRINCVIAEFKPNLAGMENLFFSKNVSSAMGVAESRGVLILCLTQNCIDLKEFSPNDIKKSVTGTASADKALVQKYVSLLLGLQTPPKPDHAADAIAAAITRIHSSNL